MQRSAGIKRPLVTSLGVIALPIPRCLAWSRIRLTPQG
jgi:hypothetical protein